MRLGKGDQTCASEEHEKHLVASSCPHPSDPPRCSSLSPPLRRRRCARLGATWWTGDAAAVAGSMEGEGRVPDGGTPAVGKEINKILGGGGGGGGRESSKGPKLR
jgi:hypothetical protein